MAAIWLSPDVSQKIREAMRGKAERDPRRERAGCGTYLGYLRLPRSCAGVALLVGYEDLLYSSLSRRFSRLRIAMAGRIAGRMVWYAHAFI